MKPYAAFPELGGAKQLVCDGDRVVWDIGKVANNAQVQQSINDFDNPRRRFDVVFEWMDLEEFMEIQWRIYAKFSDRYAHYHKAGNPETTTPYTTMKAVIPSFNKLMKEIADEYR